MEIKRAIILALFSVFLVGGFLFYFLVFTNNQLTGRIIKDSEDDHGCLTHEGYTWNETELACVREWISQNQSTRYQNNSNLSFENNSSNETLNWTTSLNITEHGAISDNLTNSSINATNQTSNNSLINWTQVFS